MAPHAAAVDGVARSTLARASRRSRVVMPLGVARQPRGTRSPRRYAAARDRPRGSRGPTIAEERKSDACSAEADARVHRAGRVTTRAVYHHAISARCEFRSSFLRSCAVRRSRPRPSRRQPSGSATACAASAYERRLEGNCRGEDPQRDGCPHSYIDGCRRVLHVGSPGLAAPNRRTTCRHDGSDRREQVSPIKLAVVVIEVTWAGFMSPAGKKGQA